MYIGLLQYRNTPVSRLKESPAQLLMKSKLPSRASLLKPQVVDSAYDKLTEWRDKQKFYYDCSAKPLPENKPNETARVRIGKTWEPAIVTAQHAAPRSYIVTTTDGTAYRRNRRHLLPTDEPPPVITEPALDEPVTPLLRQRQGEHPVVAKLCNYQQDSEGTTSWTELSIYKKQNIWAKFIVDVH